MATASDETYWILIDGASEAELRRGMAAARHSLEADGVTDPSPMFEALFKQEGLDFGNKGFLTAEERRLIRAYERANAAALQACCGSWQRLPQSSHLSVAEAVRESDIAHEERRGIIPAENFVELPDTGPHFDLRQPAHPELAL
jgi:hypothetical protein